MSEYLSKKAVFEWVNRVIEANKNIKIALEGRLDPLYWKSVGTIQCVEALLHQAESGAFDAPDEAPDEEIQRLHAELERIKANNVEVIRLSGAAAEKMQTEIERLRAALERIKKWAIKRVPLPNGDTFTLLNARHLCKGCARELAEASQRALDYADQREKGAKA